MAKQFLEHFASMAVRETKKHGVFVMPGIGRWSAATARRAWDVIRLLAKRLRFRPKRS